MIEIEKAKNYARNLKEDGEGEFEEEREGGDLEGGDEAGKGWREGGYFGEEGEEEVYRESSYCLVRLLQVSYGVFWWLILFHLFWLIFIFLGNFVK